MNLVEFQRQFADEQICRNWLSDKRWNGNPVCPHCKKDGAYKYNDGEVYKCKKCYKQFTVRIGTIFESSRIELYKWFTAIYLFTSLKKGISSVQLAKYISVTQKTAWFMLGKIRTIMNGSKNNPFDESIKSDESCFICKAENIHTNNRIITKCVYEKSIQTEIYKNVADNSLLIKDELKAYNLISNIYNNHSINHSGGQYVNGEIFFAKKSLGRMSLKMDTHSIERVCSHLRE